MPVPSTTAHTLFLGFGPYPNLPLIEMETPHIVHVLEYNRAQLCESQYKTLVGILMKRIGITQPINWISHGQTDRNA